MSAIGQCGSCSNGDHNGHDSKFGTRPGLLGGIECNCKGDCAERHANAVAKLLRELSESQPVDLFHGESS